MKRTGFKDVFSLSERVVYDDYRHPARTTTSRCTCASCPQRR
ncbi:hypothetical protein ACRAWD_11315 [Caulobacter segnis]